MKGGGGGANRLLPGPWTIERYSLESITDNFVSRDIQYGNALSPENIIVLGMDPREETDLLNLEALYLNTKDTMKRKDLKLSIKLYILLCFETARHHRSKAGRSPR